VPLTASGKLSVVASANLGALGSNQGPAVEYTWVLPSIAPILFPWLIILALLALRPNRTAAAWLIWLPLLCVMALALVPPVLPSGTEFLFDLLAALGIGLAAVWLLMSYLRHSHRLVTSLFVLLALAGFSGLAFVSRQGLNLLDGNTLSAGVLLVVGVLVNVIALTLDGWICRSRYRPMGLYLWLLVSLGAVWLLTALPFFLVALLASGGRISWNEFFLPVLGVAAANFALLLPFLILSSASGFFRERLKALLHVKAEAPPLIVQAQLPT
jgi:hypothetical protein